MDQEEKRKRQSVWGKAYYKANREKILARHKARRVAELEHVKAIERKAVAKYRAANLEKIRRDSREAKKRLYAENPEKARVEARQRYDKNVGVMRARANAYGTQHAKERAERAAKWRIANPGRVKELSEKMRQKRKERWAEFLETERQRYHKAPDKKLAAQKTRRSDPVIAAALKAYQQRYAKEHPEKRRAAVAARRAALMRAMPAWCDRAAILKIYRRAKEMTVRTGIRHEVDHIVPLRGKNVSGLHIPINLQVLTTTENRRKFNRLIDVRAQTNSTTFQTTGVAETSS